MFYKYENEQLMYGPAVMYPDGTLLAIGITDLNTLPFDGWYYFDTEQEAKDYFGMQND